MMKRARKSNRVSWASPANLCQVKLFLSEDYPSKVGLNLQDSLEAKASSMLCSSTNESIDLPPGFESGHFPNQSKVQFSHIPKIKWECPLPFVFSPNWLVAAGQESREKEVQKLREIRVLEAVYPRPSAIPPSPSVSLDVEEEEYDDNSTPLIPIIPIEEEESMTNLPKLAAAVNTHPNVQPQNLHHYMPATTSNSSDRNSPRTVSSDARLMPLAGVSSSLEADAAAASEVVAAILKSNEQAGLIDMDLLVQILNDPKMIENLINEHGVAATTASSSSNSMVTLTSGLKAATPSVPLFTSTLDVAASRNSHTSSVGFSGLKPAIPSVSSFNPTSGKPTTLFAPAIPSYSIVSSAHDKPATASAPLSRPVSSKPISPSVFMSTPTSEPHMPRPVNNNFHMSSPMSTALHTQPQPDSFLASGVKRSASFTFSSSEQSTVPLPPSGNLHTVLNNTQPIASTKPYQTSSGSASAVKDANYYKNLIRQHGADGQDKLDSQIGSRHSNFQDMKLAHNNNQGEVKYKSKKQCIYFNSSRGCRNGSDCPFQHDVSAESGAGNFLGGQSAKRFKL